MPKPVEIAATITASDGATDGAVPALERLPVERIGRYEIVKQLGAGGMGLVWEAFDPELRRGVAIKELRDARGGAFADRLRREAQALAQLSHPNVVTVYDVGEDRGELYIVMQLLAGTTLDDALARLPRTPRHVLPLLVAAGRGLEAAHAAGIVHRDFKPSNVLVDGDQVRVSDFGLSRVSLSDGGEAEGRALPLTTTVTRGLVGTPAYMSPEQFLGADLTPATDQFSFCVTLWEALAGERPFAGSDTPSLRDAVVGGKLRELPARVPRRLRRVLLRGLARDPAQRFASMTDLLAQLAHHRRALWITGGLALAAGAAAAVLAVRPTADPCRDIGAQVNAVWTATHKSALRASLGGLAPGVIAALDDRTAQWRAERLDACQATNVRHEQPAQVLDQRYRCLEHELAELRAAIALLARPSPGPELLSRAHSVVDGVDPSACSTSKVAKLAPSPRKAEVAALDGQVAQASVAMRAGRDAEVIALAKTLSPAVIAADDPQLAASWFWTLGEAAENHADTAAVKDAFRKAAEASTRAGKDAEAVRDWTSLARATVLAGDLGGVDDLVAVARAAAARSGDPATAIDIALVEADIAGRRGDDDGAAAACHRAIDLIDRLHVTGPGSLHGLACLLDQQTQAKDYEHAIPTARAVLARSVEIYGADHPETLHAVRMLAVTLSYQGDLAEARPLWDRVVTTTEQLFGKDSIAVAHVLRDLAATETPDGERTTPEALAAIRRAVAIGDRALPVTDPDLARLYETLGYVASVHKERAEEAAALQRAMALYEKLDNPLALARVVYNLADYYKGTAHQCELALPLYKRAAKLAAESGKAALMQAYADAGASICAARAHDWVTADAEYAAAAAGMDAAGDVVGGARARQNYAEMLGADGNHARAKQIAKQAIDLLVDKPAPADEIRKELVEELPKL